MIQRSVFLKIAFGLVVLYVLNSIGFALFDINWAYEQQKLRQAKTITHYVKVGEELLRAGDVDNLSYRLDDALKVERLDYYLIQKNGERLVYGNVAGADEDLEFGPLDVDRKAVETATHRHYVRQVGDYTLVLGHKISVANFIKAYLDISLDVILKDVVFACGLIFALVIYSFRDLIQVVASIRKRGGKRTEASVAKSKEVLTLIQGFKGFQENVEALARENAVYRNQVLPALQKELFSGKAPPYEFACTLVRTDINNFSHIFATADRAQFMKEVNDFFTGVAHIVSRYSGFVYEFIGDEVIYYFKDDQPNCAALALAAVRDVNKLADQFSERTERENGYPFRVKTALSAGTLRFGPLVNGHSLAGSPLIESVRMLSHVHDKSANTVLMDDNVWEMTTDVCTTQELGVFQLKGVSKSRRLHVYQAHVPLNHHLRQGTPSSTAIAQFYRSDDEIREILDFVLRNYEDLKQESILQLLGAFRGYQVTSPSPEIKQRYLDLLEMLTTTTKTDKSTYALTSLIASARNLFPQGALTGRLRDVLLKCLEIDENRVVANTIDVFTALDPDATEPVFQKLARNENNRVSANALIKQAKQEWTSGVAKRIRSMITKFGAYHRASALYALGEISAFLRQSDEVAFHADLGLQSLLEEALTMVTHKNQVIRRQAAMAVIKAGRAKELENYIEGQKHLDQETRTELRALIQVYAPSYAGSAQKAA